MRVPLNFDWPVGVTWKGYLNPYRPIECTACNGSGMNPATKKLSDDWYTHLRTDGQEGWGLHLEQGDVDALVKADRLWDFTRVPINDEQKELVRKKLADGDNSWLPFNNGYHPTAEEVNEWAKQGFGHDSINHSICVEARAKREDIYGSCRLCGGMGHYWCENKYEALWESWKPIEPPEGEGFQLWSTTGEGTPSSPVFATLDELCQWCEENATTFAHFKASKDEWVNMLQAGFVVHKEGANIFM